MADYKIESTAPVGRRIHPIGTVSEGWRLLVTRTAHDCAECGQRIKPFKGAWFRASENDKTRGEYLCQHGHEDRTGVEA
jgi:hypothetical protein